MCLFASWFVVWFALDSDAAKPNIPEQELELTARRFVLQPFGEIPDALLKRHALILERRFSATVVIAESEPLPQSAVDGNRKQVDALKLLDYLFERRPVHTDFVVGVTLEDLYADGWDYLYGFAQVDGRVAVYSLSRFRETESNRRWGDAMLRRLDRVLVHEVGHIFDLPHCTHPHCVMNTVDREPALDQLSVFFCARCARRVKDLADRDEDPGLARADELYLRGSLERARFRYVVALLQRPTNPERLNRVGVSSAALGAPLLAEMAYRSSILIDPSYPLPYYNYGLLYAPFDAHRSVRLLQAGFERDHNRVEALGFLGLVYTDVFEDEARALRYFQLYVREGGQDPEVLMRYQRLVRPSLFEFEEGEVFVFIANQGDAALASRALVASVKRVIWEAELRSWTQRNGLSTLAEMQ